MAARRLDGTAWAARLREEIQPRVAAFTLHHGRPPGLAVVLAGHNPASEVYVRNKIATVNAHGCHGQLHRLPETASLDDALAVVRQLNEDDRVDGILVQSPLPAGMGADAEQRVFDAVAPAKDVDGFHPMNVGLLVQKRPTLVACTPLGCAELLDREGIPLRGRTAVVIGRSDIVGKPMALLLLHRDATVTICHSRTEHLPEVAGRPMSGGGHRPRRIRHARLRQAGATVIDVGINRWRMPPRWPGCFPRVAEAPPVRREGQRAGRRRPPGVEDVAGAITRCRAARPADDRHGAATPSPPPSRGPRRGLMRRVALTGGIATGKSYVTPACATPRAVVDADVLARRSWRRAHPGSPPSSIVSARGDQGRRHAHRAALGEQVFADAAARRDLEAIVHPAVRTAIDSSFSSLPPATPLAVADIPLLFETGRAGEFDTVVVVACRPETQVARVMARDGLSRAQAEARLAAQIPIADKVARADHVIWTDGTFADTDGQVEALLGYISADG